MPTHAYACIVSSIHQANCEQLQAALSYQLRHFSWCALPQCVFVCCVQWSIIYQSIHLPPVVPTLIHQPTLCCLISLSANVPSAICLTFPTLISQSVSPRGTGKTWMHLDTAEATQPRVFLTQLSDIKQVTNPDLPRIDKNGCTRPDDVDKSDAGVVRSPDIFCVLWNTNGMVSSLVHDTGTADTDLNSIRVIRY